MRELSRELGVGRCCGKCLPEAKRTLSACLSGGDAPAAHGFFAPASPEYAV